VWRRGLIIPTPLLHRSCRGAGTTTFHSPGQKFQIKKEKTEQIFFLREKARKKKQKNALTIRNFFETF
jgi:hypothetical protein